MYQAHPSHELNCHFSHRPFQGVEPFATRFLFIGLDANYNEDIECSLVFQSVLEYHQDGIAFWQRHNVHHPFLLPQYAGDGRRYHRNFARIGFTRQHASIVSFVELLHVPTVGRNKLEPGDLEPVQCLRNNKARKASTTSWALVASLRSQFFHSRRHFSSQANERSTTQRLGSTAN
jgi:hypothetical protein